MAWKCRLLWSRFHAVFYNTLIINASKNQAWLRPAEDCTGMTTFPCRNYPRCGLTPKVFDNMLEKYRKLLPKFHDIIDMSFLGDKSIEAYKQCITSWAERISKSADSTKKCSNDNLKSAQTTISIKHCILTEKVFVRRMAFIIFG